MLCSVELSQTDKTHTISLKENTVDKYSHETKQSGGCQELARQSRTNSFNENRV